MRAWRVHDVGEPAEVLHLEDVPPPRPQAGQVRLRVAACGLNFSDVLLCRGTYQDQPSPPFTPGTEIVGTVSETGPDAVHAVGSRVLGRPTLPHGGLAEECVLDGSRVFTIPDSMPDEVAAALHVTYQTGWFGLFRRAGLLEGETLLVHAGAGGVGSAAIQLGVAAGARVIATAGGPEKVELCRRLGAEIAVDYRSEDFRAAVDAATDGRGADVIYDPVGGDTFDRSRRCVAFEGRIVVLGFASGTSARLPTNHLFVKNYTVHGLHWPLYERLRPDLVQECHEKLLEGHGAGHLRPLVDSVRDLAEVPRALDDLAARRTTGKVVIRV